MTCEYIIAVFICEIFIVLSGILAYFLFNKATFVFVVQLIVMLLTLWLFGFLLYWISPSCLT